MAGRNPKPLVLLDGHLTKKQKEEREQAEKRLLTGTAMKIWPSVKENKYAKKEFVRIQKLLRKIGKDDALYENIINRYAKITAECLEFEERQDAFFKGIEELRESRASPDSDLTDSQYYTLLHKMQENIIKLDKQLQAKRSMMLSIEKENALTISASIRTVPPKKEEKELTGIAAFRQRRGEG